MAYYRQWVQGEQVSYSDLLDLQDRTRYLATMGAGSILRAASWIQYNPASITLSVDGTGENVLFGGPSTNLFLDYRYVDYVPQESFPVSSNASGSGQRNDIIAGLPVDVQGSAFQRGVKIGNTVTLTTCYTQYDGLETEYVVGTPGEGDPTVPDGYVPLVRIAVPAGASTVSESDLIILLPTAADIIASEISGGVTSLNSLQGAISAVSRTPSYLAIDQNNGQLGFSVLTGSLVTGVNGITGGNVPIVAGTGISVEKENDEIVISNTSEQSLLGLSYVARGIFTANGSVSVQLGPLPGSPDAAYIIEAYAVNFDFSDTSKSATLVGTFLAAPNNNSASPYFNYNVWDGGTGSGTTATATSTVKQTIYDRQCVLTGQAAAGAVIKVAFSLNGGLRAGISAGSVILRATMVGGS